MYRRESTTLDRDMNQQNELFDSNDEPESVNPIENGGEEQAQNENEPAAEAETEVTSEEEAEPAYEEDDIYPEQEPVFVRLNKLLADNGVASRRRADQLIADGEVMVDGKIITALGTKVDPVKQRVEWDGVIMRLDGDLQRYYLLNKPTGVVCTNDEKELRRRAWDMITDPAKGRIYPVGRLDVDSSGLIILTNDGSFTHKVTHPSFGIEKTYEIKIPGNVQDDDLDRIRRGLHLAEGKTAGARIIVMSRNDHATKLSITLTEGKNREVRRVFARFGYKVRELHRVSIGPLKDRGLSVGNWRQLGPEEVKAILAAGQESSGPRPKRKPRFEGRGERIDRHAPDGRKGSDGKNEDGPGRGRQSRPRGRGERGGRDEQQSGRPGQGNMKGRGRSGGGRRGSSSSNSTKQNPWGK